MRPVGLAIDVAIFCLIAASWWIHVGKYKNLSGALWRWILSAFGLLLVSTSFALYAIMLARLLRFPEVAINTDSVLALVRSYTRFYPTSCGLLGAALGLCGKGASRWMILAAGMSVGFLWSLFTISLL
jgi:hypothetical protein